MVYLDNDATSPIDPRVLEEMKPYQREKFETPSGIYSNSLEIYKAIEESKDVISSSINSNSDEIIFTSGLTESNNLAIRGVAQKSKSKHLITTEVEHPSVLETFRALERRGFEVDYVEVDENGLIDLEDLEDKIKDDTVLVSVNMVENITGAIQPIKKVVETVKNIDSDILVHSDAGSGFGKMDIDVNEIGLDSMGFTSHKIHGPKGIGGLFLKEDVEIEPLMTGHHSTSDVRPGLENVPGIVGFRKAVEIEENERIESKDHVRKLQKKLMKGIEENIDNIKLNGPTDLNRRSPYNVNYSFLGAEGEAIALRLDEENIQVDTGSACASPDLEPNYVLLAMGRKLEESHGSIKMSLSRFNTEEEIEEVIENLEEVIEDLRSISSIN